MASEITNGRLAAHLRLLKDERNVVDSDVPKLRTAADRLGGWVATRLSHLAHEGSGTTVYENDATALQQAITQLED